MFIYAALIFLIISLPWTVDAATLEFQENTVEVQLKVNNDNKTQPLAPENQLKPGPLIPAMDNHFRREMMTFDVQHSSITQPDSVPEKPSILSEISRLDEAVIPTQAGFFKKSSEPSVAVDLLKTGVSRVSDYAVENEMEDIYNRTANTLQRLNEISKDLNDEINFKLYRSLEYISLSESLFNKYTESNILNRQAEAEVIRNLNASNSPSDDKNSEARGRFFGLLLTIPKLFTLSNLFIMLAILLAGNGLFRAFRYVLLRL